MLLVWVVAVMIGCGRIDYAPSDAAGARIDARAIDAGSIDARTIDAPLDDAPPDDAPLDAPLDDAPVLDASDAHALDVPDAWADPDRDGDGVPDGVDVCPDHDDPRQHDEDGDGIGDACDVCPHRDDAAQIDGDGDGVGDACDPEPDVGGNEILRFLAFDEPGIPAGWSGETEVGGGWTVGDDEIRVALTRADVAMFTFTPSPPTRRIRVEIDVTISAIAGYIAGEYEFRNVSIVDDVRGSPGTEDVTFAGLIQNARTGGAAVIEVLTLGSGTVVSSIDQTTLGAPLAAGTRYRLRYDRVDTVRTAALEHPTTATATGPVPVSTGAIGLRVRGMTIRVHHLAMIR